MCTFAEKFKNMELRIKQILKEKGITAKSLAAQIMVKDKKGKDSPMTPQYLNNIINGGKGASLNTLQKIAEALNVPMASLFADYEANAEERNILICPNCGKTIKLEPKLRME